jgi:xylulokinase
VVLLPYFDGERTPNLPDATGTLAGLRTDTDPAQLARAAYEGVVCGLLDAFDALGAAGVPTDHGRVLVVGGGAHSPVYPQLLADLLQRPVDVAATAEYVARGACVQAAAVLTGSDVATVARDWAPSDGRTVEPDRTVDAARVRGQYGELLQRTHPESGDRT